ncbi:MAG: gluconokinase [Beijerinckiaceae bacterium]|nr:gluconokinase [Beijerinckiaceae bacterium]
MIPRVLIVMGVSGCGKSTVGQALGEELGWEFRDGDAFHPPANVAKMKSGAPLTDEDRWPWLDAIARYIDETRAQGGHAIIACSALKRVYRDRLKGARPDVTFVHLAGSKELIEARMAARQNHFMPLGLLDSQFATLEAPSDDEGAMIVSVAGAPDEIVHDVLKRMGLRAAAE